MKGILTGKPLYFWPRSVGGWVLLAGATGFLVWMLSGAHDDATATGPAAPTPPDAPPDAPATRSFRQAPDGYWYIVAYEQQAGPSTIGAPTWNRYAYYDGKAQTGASASGVALGAEFSHRKPFTPGAIRAWWWNGMGWEPWPELARNW